MTVATTTVDTPRSVPVREDVRPGARIEDKRIANARPDLVGFLGLGAQLAALLAVFALYRVDEGGFLRLTALAFGAFAIHYWLPFAWKEYWWIGVSVGGALLLLGAAVGGLVFASGLLIYGIVALRTSYRARLLLVLAVGALLTYGRAAGAWGLPWQFWPAFGAVFMFRLMIYMYDLRFAKGRPSLKEFCVYFFPLPNFYFLLFPVIDFQTLKRTYYQRDIHAVAQQGIVWMVRGAVQLSLYRVIYHLKPPFTPAEVTSFGSFALGAVAVYLLYLRVSGQFHVIVGLMHLFGYDLPETHRKYLLANSLTDFWRRINIYWKDFMVKLVYFPVYFRLRRGGETRAQVLATAAVFTATWALHSYQWFWLRGQVLFSWPDTFFWMILGVLVIANLLWEQRRPRRATYSVWSARNVAQVAATFSLIVLLWSMWNTTTLREWFEIVTWWEIG